MNVHPVYINTFQNQMSFSSPLFRSKLFPKVHSLIHLVSLLTCQTPDTSFTGRLETQTENSITNSVHNFPVTTHSLHVADTISIPALPIYFFHLIKFKFPEHGSLFGCPSSKYFFIKCVKEFLLTCLSLPAQIVRINGMIAVLPWLLFLISLP